METKENEKRMKILLIKSIDIFSFSILLSSSFFPTNPLTLCSSYLSPSSLNLRSPFPLKRLKRKQRGIKR